MAGEFSKKDGNPMLNIMGLWTSTPKNGGKNYLRGVIGKVQVLIFENENKKSEKHPDYNLCISLKKKPDDKIPDNY